MNAERRGEQLPDTAPRRQADRSTWPPPPAQELLGANKRFYFARD